MSTNKTTLGGRVVAHLGLIAVCLGMPLAFTGLAPVSRITLQRQATGIEGRADTMVLLFVPFRHQSLTPITRVSHTLKKGEVKYRRRAGNARRRRVRTEDEAHLLLHSPGAEISIPISPVNVENAEKKVADFLAGNTPPQLTLWVVANWKFGVFFGGGLSCLAYLYVLGMTLALLRGVGLFGLALFQGNRSESAADTFMSHSSRDNRSDGETRRSGAGSYPPGTAGPTKPPPLPPRPGRN